MLGRRGRFEASNIDEQDGQDGQDEQDGFMCSCFSLVCDIRVWDSQIQSASILFILTIDVSNHYALK